MVINTPAIDGSDPGAVPGSSTKSASARNTATGCVVDGADTGSTDVERGQSSPGEIPPLSVQNEQMQT